MADATQLPSVSSSQYFYWPNCELTRPLTASTSDTTAYWSVVPRDEDGTALTGGFLIGATNRSGETEIMWVGTNQVSADGLSATVVRGIDIMGPDYTAGSSDFVYAIESGQPVFCAITPNIQYLIVQALQGGVATGGSSMRVGPDSSGDIYLYFDNGDATPPYIKWNQASTIVEISVDGVSTFEVGAGVGTVTGGDGITVTSGDIDVDTTDTTTFVKTSSGAGDEDKVPVLNASGQLADGFINAGSATLSSLTVTADEINTAVADSQVSYTAAEAITEDNAVALLPNQVEYFSQLTDANLALGDDNARARYAIKIIPAVSGTMTDFKFRAAEASAGATALGNLNISFETDNSGAPSGTAVSGGTETISQATQRTWGATIGTRTATWDSPISFTAGTTYWLVFDTDSIDGTNYLILGVNSTYDENYAPFTRLTYDLGGASWGSSVTNATPFFWGNTESVPFGSVVVQCDANFLGRTWNFIGFANSTVAAGSSVTVSTQRYDGLASLTTGANYYLSTTAGAISTTRLGNLYSGSSFEYKIGRAENPTTIKVEPGEKFLFGQISNNATTATTLITWFNPKRMEISGGSINSATAANITLLGIYDGANNYNTNFNNDEGGLETFTNRTNSSFGNSADVSTFYGSAGTPTGAGLTYTVTKDGSPTGSFYLTWKLFG